MSEEKSTERKSHIKNVFLLPENSTPQVAVQLTFSLFTVCLQVCACPDREGVLVCPLLLG